MIIESTEKEIGKRPHPTFDELLERLDKLTVEESERIARNRVDGWKDQLRDILRPFENKFDELHPQDATTQLLLHLIAQVEGRARKDAIVTHWLFRQIRMLEEKHV